MKKIENSIDVNKFFRIYLQEGFIIDKYLCLCGRTVSYFGVAQKKVTSISNRVFKTNF